MIIHKGTQGGGKEMHPPHMPESPLPLPLPLLTPVMQASLMLVELKRACKKLEFQLVLWPSSFHILLAWDNFLLVVVNDFVRR